MTPERERAPENINKLVKDYFRDQFFKLQVLYDTHYVKGEYDQAAACVIALKKVNAFLTELEEKESELR